MKKLFNLLFAPGRLALTIALGLLLTTTAAHATYTTANLVQRLESDGRFKTLLVALEVAGLKDTVATGGVFTILAPTDAAFAALPPGTVESLVTNVPALQNILLYHAIGGKKSLSQLVHDSTTTTLQGNPVLAMTEGFKVRINGQLVDYPSLPASNGVIHPIEGVLIPPAEDIDINSLVDVLALDGRFNTLIAAVTAAGLADDLATGGPFTVFAPTDDAFAALPPGTVESLLGDIPALQNILLYHVLDGSKTAYELLWKRSAETLQGEEVAISLNRSGIFINKSPLISPNVKAPNGIIHVIGAVLLPPPPESNLIETLEKDGRFTTLLAALEIAGLKDTVATGGVFTIFAPTDDAFAALPPGTVESLVTNIPALKNILLYHAVEGSQSSKELLRERRVETLQGSNVRVYKWRNGVFVNRSQVITADVTASNGTIHAINQVLLPPVH
jgi:transforming growth factor-beta-induced protein